VTVPRSARGFSLVELLLSLTIALVVTASAFGLMLPSQAVGSSRTETADVQQRLRVAADTLAFRIGLAGAGGYAETGSPLSEGFAPILPYRAGGGSPDPPGMFRTDAITIAAVPKSGSAPSTISYALKSDVASGTFQLIVNEGGADAPVVDHVVALSFEYFGDPSPPTLIKPLGDPVGPWTTYGARPSTTAVPPFAEGENCLFVNTAPPPQPPSLQPRLATLGPPESLVALPASLLTDGPWCPNDAVPDRWDADLLRVRSIVVVLRVQAAIAALRGSGGLFRHPGTSHNGLLWVPDQEIRFRVSPRNMNRAR